MRSGVGVERVARGRFVTIEGIEGSGKSTLLAGLCAALETRGIDVVATREPGGTDVGDALRAVFVTPGLRIDPLAEAFVVNASRAQHCAERIEPALRRGAWVLCDRFTDATLAYQGYGRGLALDTLRALASVATRGLVPDRTLLVDVPVDVSRERVIARAESLGTARDRVEREPDAFHERVRAGYLALAADDSRFSILHGEIEPRRLLERALAELDR